MSEASRQVDGRTAVTHDGTRWSNAEQDRVEIEPSDPSWPERFERASAAIRSALGDGFAYRVLHVGSTAVRGLAAKPIVDVVLEVPDRTRWPSLVAPLAELGYVHWAGNPDTTRMFFVKGMPPFGARRTHHVHVHGPEATAALIGFRDHLCTHPHDAARYEALKRELARGHPTDRDAYTKAKTAFVHDVLRRAGEPRRWRVTSTAARRASPSIWRAPRRAPPAPRPRPARATSPRR